MSAAVPWPVRQEDKRERLTVYRDESSISAEVVYESIHPCRPGTTRMESALRSVEGEWYHQVRRREA